MSVEAKNYREPTGIINRLRGIVRRKFGKDNLSDIVRKEKERGLDMLTQGMRQEFQTFSTGRMSEQVLYSSDLRGEGLFVSLPNSNTEVIHKEVTRRLSGMLENEFEGKESNPALKKTPKPLTIKLREFLDQNPDGELMTQMTIAPLKSPPGKKLLLAVERYMDPQNPERIMSMVIFAKRFTLEYMPGSDDETKLVPIVSGAHSVQS